MLVAQGFERGFEVEHVLERHRALGLTADHDRVALGRSGHEPEEHRVIELVLKIGLQQVGTDLAVGAVHPCPQGHGLGDGFGVDIIVKRRDGQLGQRRASGVERRQVHLGNEVHESRIRSIRDGRQARGQAGAGVGLFGIEVIGSRLELRLLIGQSRSAQTDGLGQVPSDLDGFFLGVTLEERLGDAVLDLTIGPPVDACDDVAEHDRRLLPHDRVGRIQGRQHTLERAQLGRAVLIVDIQVPETREGRGPHIAPGSGGQEQEVRNEPDGALAQPADQERGLALSLLGVRTESPEDIARAPERPVHDQRSVRLGPLLVRPTALVGNAEKIVEALEGRRDRLSVLLGHRAPQSPDQRLHPLGL
ncbi:MAG: hypothetical protein MOGMAGMI_02054 [Candidatus Omnitrophica bacterium]|nr:hypothetical protein [Candidatus Omnitrophota bacterium]